MYYTYILRCEDNTLYTGIATDLQRRFNEHLQQDPKTCAKYTLSHKAKKIECAWECEDKVLASKLEFWIKKGLTKSQKESLIKDNSKLEKLLGEKIDCTKYSFIKIN